MKLNTKMRYGTRALLELALHYEQGPMSLGEIARTQELSEKYLEALLGVLRSVGLVRSQRGAQGGYFLAKPPEQVTLRDIFDVLEGPDPFVECTSAHEVCPRRAACATQEVWSKMYQAAMRVLESITLADLARRQAELSRSSAEIYSI